MTFLVGAFPLREKCPTIAVTVFLVGAFQLREKCPTIAVTVFFSRRFSIKGKMPDYSSDCFFSSDHNPHTDRSTFLTIRTILKSYNSYLANLKYFESLRSSIFTSKKLKGTQREKPKEYFRLWDFFSIKIFSPKGPPSIFFGVFRQNGCWKIPKGPFQFFRHCETFFKNFFSPKVPLLQFFFDDLRQNGWKISKCPLWCANSVQLLGFSGTVEENTLKSFCCFWALDMAPTWAVPGLFFFSLGQSVPRSFILFLT